jgi:large conductance mechanosensitive channel
MGMMQEFKEFALKGNVVDMAVGVIIGGAFGKIVSSLVADVLMPPIGLLLGGANFSDLYLNLGKETYATLELANKAGAPVVRYGAFLQAVIDFLIVAFVIFMVIRQMNKLLKHEAPKKA